MKQLVFLFLLLLSVGVLAQEKNAYGLYILRSAEYKASLKTDPNKRLLEIKKYIPNIQLDIRYAGTNNFAKQAVYHQARAFVRLPLIKALKSVQSELRKSGFGLKIFDAYRPYGVTLKFFEIIQDKNFVASPEEGSRHNRGCAVDLSIINLKTGKELSMPTPFDSFAIEAGSNFMDLPADLIKNRSILRNVMEKNGFTALDSEWWHFDFRNWKNFELMDIPFEEL